MDLASLRSLAIRSLMAFQNRSFIMLLRLLLPLCLIVAFVLSALGGISYMSPTIDEPVHQIRGIMLWETGDFRLNRNHPILANAVNAIPLLLIQDLHLPATDSEEWKRADIGGLARKFYDLNGNIRSVTKRILYPARLMTVAFAAIAMGILFVVIRREWGFGVASIFLFLCALEPNIIAHSSLVTTDCWIMFLAFGSTLALYRYAKTHNKISLGVFILLSFFSLLTKYSAIPLAILWLLLLFLIRLANVNAAFSLLKRSARALFVTLSIALVWFFLLSGAYGFRLKTMSEISYADAARTEVHMQKIAGVAHGSTYLKRVFQYGYQHLPLPFPEYFLGFFGNVIVRDYYGPLGYLLGHTSKTGWWYYFPLAMLFKIPVPLLVGVIAFLIYSVSWSWRRFKALPEARRKLRVPINFHPEYVLVLVPIFFLALSAKSSINLGLRHILLLFPFISLATGFLVVRYWKSHICARIAAIVLGFWFLLSSIIVYPYHLEYFNELAGGPAKGYKYLLDSNLDWGQDEFLVQDYLDRLPKGINVYVNPLHEIEKGLVIIDVGLLMGNTEKARREKTAWIRKKFLTGEIKPKDRIAYTHMVFEF